MIIDHVSLHKGITIDAWQRVIADMLLKLALAAHTESACSGSLTRIEHFPTKERAFTKLAPVHATLNLKKEIHFSQRAQNLFICIKIGSSTHPTSRPLESNKPEEWAGPAPLC